MPIPDKSREQIMNALKKFDTTLRNTPKWEEWEKKLNFKYVLIFDEQHYPVKEIIRLATNGFTGFSGGQEANTYLEKRGFKIAALREEEIEFDDNVDLHKLDGILQKFAKYRSEKEQDYLEGERNYKLRILRHVQDIFSQIMADPETSKKRLHDLMVGEGIDPVLRNDLDNLLGYRFSAAQKDDFRVFLKNIDTGMYKELFSELFDDERDIEERFREFRFKVNETYQKFYDEGKFWERKKNKPSFSATLTAILLAGYDYKKYILYKPTEYESFLGYLDVPLLRSVEGKYKLFLDISRFIVEYSAGQGYPVEDLIDAHSMVYMFSQYAEMRHIGEPSSSVSGEPEKEIYQFIQEQQFIFPASVITNYLMALVTKPFVILTGISGTGKTKLAQLAAEYVTGGDRSRVAFVSVRPDWTDNTCLLGYYNSITEKYEVTPVLELLLRAAENPGQSYFIILDEMNIAKVEHYFSDFLSCLESRRINDRGELIQEPVILHNKAEEITYIDKTGKEWEIPATINIPANVFFTGTVNIDETTYMFSPKVLDRANTIEFNEVYLTNEDLTDDNNNGFRLKAGVNAHTLFTEARHPSSAHFYRLRTEYPAYTDRLIRINHCLRRFNLHFGYRVVNEIAAFLVNVAEYCQKTEKVMDIAFDRQITQKILPKFYGNAAKLHEPLQALREEIEEKYEVSREKISRMLDRLQEQGFTSFIE